MPAVIHPAPQLLVSMCLAVHPSLWAVSIAVSACTLAFIAFSWLCIFNQPFCAVLSLTSMPISFWIAVVYWTYLLIVCLSLFPQTTPASTFPSSVTIISSAWNCWVLELPPLLTFGVLCCLQAVHWKCQLHSLTVYGTSTSLRLFWMTSLTFVLFNIILPFISSFSGWFCNILSHHPPAPLEIYEKGEAFVLCMGIVPLFPTFCLINHQLQWKYMRKEKPLFSAWALCLSFQHLSLETDISIINLYV